MTRHDPDPDTDPNTDADPDAATDTDADTDADPDADGTVTDRSTRTTGTPWVVGPSNVAAVLDAHDLTRCKIRLRTVARGNHPESIPGTHTATELAGRINAQIINEYLDSHDTDTSPGPRLTRTRRRRSRVSNVRDAAAVADADGADADASPGPETTRAAADVLAADRYTHYPVNPRTSTPDEARVNAVETWVRDTPALPTVASLTAEFVTPASVHVYVTQLGSTHSDSGSGSDSDSYLVPQDAPVDASELLARNGGRVAGVEKHARLVVELALEQYDDADVLAADRFTIAPSPRVECCECGVATPITEVLYERGCPECGAERARGSTDTV